MLYDIYNNKLLSSVLMFLITQVKLLTEQYRMARNFSRDRKFAVFVDFVQTLKLFILGIICV